MAENTSAGNQFDGQIDPEIADLMGISADAPAATADSTDESSPGFSDLFGQDQPIPQASSQDEVDLTKATFPVITVREEEEKPFFKDKNYYKKALSGEGETSQRLHKILGSFLNAEDPKDRSLYRGQLIAAYWNFASSIAAKVHLNLPAPKLLTLRFGALIPSIISPEQRSMIAKIIHKNETGEPVHYTDEWLSKVATGRINPSATDETKNIRRSEGEKIVSRIEKTRGQKDVQLGLIKKLASDIENEESVLAQKVNQLKTHQYRTDVGGVKDAYTAEQRSILNELNTIIKNLAGKDRELTKLFDQLKDASSELDDLTERASEAGESLTIDSSVVEQEFNAVRQMAKMCVGRQGNHVPILMKQYFRSNIRDIATRENVIIEMGAVEAIDPSIFKRTFKRQTNRIVPHVILVPSYGERGICWEPFERFNRATSRGRIAIPIFPKDVRLAVITALADLRWQVAKEKAQHYWMEEGLTGHYYQWFTEKKLRGDVKEYFIRDYVLWITKESEGTQKLDREVRGVFWRNMPFPQHIKDNLKNRGFVYNELHKKDLNREMSDGY